MEWNTQLIDLVVVVSMELAFIDAILAGGTLVALVRLVSIIALLLP